MQTKTFHFPQFRQLKGVDRWYKIISPDTFIEINKVGSKYVLHETIAKQYPEHVRIQDMLVCHENRWVEIEAEIFEEQLNKTEN